MMSLKKIIFPENQSLDLNYVIHILKKLKITKQALGSSFLLLLKLSHGSGRCSQSQMSRFPCPAEGNEILRQLES